MRFYICQEHISYSLMKNPKLKGDKPAFESNEQRKKMTSDFIKQKRAMMKEQKNNESVFGDLKNIIDSGDHLLLEKQLGILTPKLALNFLFAEDELKRNNYSLLLTHAKAQAFLGVLNAWSESNKIKIDEMINKQENQVINYNWKENYSKILKVLVTTYSGLQEPTKDFMILLGKKDSIFHQLSVQYLTLNQIIIFCEQSSSQTEALNHFFKPLLKNSDLSDMIKLAEEVSTYILILEREQLWTDSGFSELLISKRDFDAGILQLKELGFNFWHELAVKDPTTFLKTCSDLTEYVFKDEIQNILSNLTMQIDNSGETPLDICLRSWEYKHLKILISRYQKIPQMILTSNSLIKILKNRKLSQKEKEQIMLSCLSSDKGKKGYAKIIQEKVRYSPKTIIKKQKFKKIQELSKANKSYIVEEAKDQLINILKYTFSIGYTANTLKIALDPSGFYPLVLYLNHYKEKANLQIVEALWLPVINKRDIKKLYLLFMKDQKQKSLVIDPASSAFEEFKILYEYYQPLWKAVTLIKPGEVLEYFVGKCYLNVNEIDVLSRRDKFEVTFMGPHFMRFCLLSSPSLEETPQNKAIIQAILHCKDKEREFGEYHLYSQLIKSLNDIESFHKSEEYLPKILRKELKTYFDTLTVPEWLQLRELWARQTLFAYVVDPVLKKKIEKPALISLEDIVSKIGEQSMTAHIKSETGKIRDLYVKIFEKTKRKVSKGQQNIEGCSRRECQNIYMKTYLDDTNETFILNLSEEVNGKRSNWGKGEGTGFKYFKLRPNEHHLHKKMSALASINLNAYFSRFSKRPLYLDDIPNKSWKNILTRMYEDHCSFFAALMTEPTASFKQFQYLFQNANKEHLCDALLRQKNYLTNPPYFVSPPNNICNIEFVIDLIKFTGQGEMMYVLYLLMAENVDFFLKKITKLTTEKKETLEQIQTKKEFEKFIQKSMSMLTQNSSCLGQKDKIVEEIIFPILKTCHLKKLTQHCKVLIQATGHELLFTHDLSLEKLTLQPESDHSYADILCDSSESTFKKWINYFSQINKQNILIKIYTKFDMEVRFKILSQLADRYGIFLDPSRQEEDGNAKIPSKILMMMLLILKTVPADAKIDTFMKLAALMDKPLLEAMNPHKRSLFMSAHDVSNTTAALILLDISEESPQNRSFDSTSKNEMVFYLKEGKQVKRYTQLDFYPKSSQSHFKGYLQNIQKYHSYCHDIKSHLQRVVGSLVEAEQWDKLLELLAIKALQKILIVKIFMNLHKKANRELLFKRQVQGKIAKIINLLFELYQEHKIQWNDQIFRAAFYLDYKRTMKIMQPKEKISLTTFVECLKHNPEVSEEFIKADIKVDFISLPASMFPLRKHYVHDLPALSWLVDELRLENKVCHQDADGSYLLYQVNRAWLNSSALLPYTKEIYSQQNIHEAIVKDLLKNKNITDLTAYENYIPGVRQMIKTILFSGTLQNIQIEDKQKIEDGKMERFLIWARNKAKKGPCIRLKTVSSQLLTLFIKENILIPENDEQKVSGLIRIIDTGDFGLIELYSSKNEIALNRQNLDRIGTKLSMTFVEYLFKISNQDFLISFITKYKIFEMYAIEEWSPAVLSSICRNRFNQLMRFLISYIASKYKVTPTFAAEPQENSPKITESGSFYLPVTLSKEFNFYECYFLIKQSGNQCPFFSVSSRFISKVDDKDYDYIPEFQRRIKINNSIMTHLPESKSLAFRNNIIMPAVFQLEHSQLEKPFASVSAFSKSLFSFIKNIVNRHFALDPEASMGIFEKLTLMILTSPETNIPLQELQKKYPSQMKVLDNLREHFASQKFKGNSLDLIEKCSEFRPLLLQYNPDIFLQKEQFKRELIGTSTGDINFTEYLKGVQINVSKLQKEGLIAPFIENNFFPEQSKISLFSSTSSLTLKRETLILLLIDLSLHGRQWSECQSFQTMLGHKTWGQEKEEYMLYLISHHMNYMTDASVFDLSLWNKMINTIQEIEKRREALKLPSFERYNDKCLETMIENYTNILKRQLENLGISCSEENLKEILSAITKAQIGKHSPQGIFLELTILMNVIFVECECSYLSRKIKSLTAGTDITDISISFDQKFNNNALFKQNDMTEEEPYMRLQMKLMIDGVVGSKRELVLSKISADELLNNVNYDLYCLKLKQHPQLTSLNDYCANAERHQYFKGFTFKIEPSSFKKIEDFTILERLFDKQHLNGESIFTKATQDIEIMEERLQGFRNIKLYNMSDIFGPINFHEETNDSKIIDCLTFYELLPLPKDKSITVKVQNPPPETERNQRMVQHVEKYFTYYINASRDEPVDIEFDNQILIYIKEGEKGVKKVHLGWEMMAAWTVSDLTQTVLHFNSELNQRIQHVLDVRISFLSLLDHYKTQLSQSLTLPLRESTEKLLSNSSFNDLLESILMMVTEDVKNIMTMVKGIIIKFNINQNKKQIANIIISENTSITTVHYEVKEHLLYLTFSMNIKNGLNKGKQSEDVGKLVSRKQFLDSVFTSTQFLTDYFLVKGDLDRECLNIGTSISKKLNATTHLHIQYNELYAYIDQMRKRERPLRDMEGLLSRAKHYLQGSMERIITQYLGSQELANKHQVMLMDKCQAINTDSTLLQVQKASELIYDTHSLQPASGLKDIDRIMSEIGSDDNVKNSFLIQIYKSYYSALVAEGMTFLVGYQSATKKAQVVTIKKAQNINEINVVQLDFLLLVSKSIPTQDQINHNKIIRIFVTDNNKNLYKMNDKLQKFMLSLPPESQERKMSIFAPIAPSDLTIAFKHFEKSMESIIEKDDREKKVFYLELPPLDEKKEKKTIPDEKQYRLKLRPVDEKLLSPISLLKKSLSYKDAISKLTSRLLEFTSDNMRIIVDPPEAHLMNVDMNLDQMLSLVCMDLVQTLNRFEYDLMRVPALDCKLSVERGMTLNQNAIIELRKRKIIENYKTIRLRLRSDKSGLTFDKKEIIINIPCGSEARLSTVDNYFSAILYEIIKKEVQNHPKDNVLYMQIKDLQDHLLKSLDILNLLEYQKEQLEMACLFIKNTQKKENLKSTILFDTVKSKILIEDGQIRVRLNVQSAERDFYPTEEIIQAYFSSKTQNTEINQNLKTRYVPRTNSVQIQNSTSSSYKLYQFIDKNDLKEVEFQPRKSQKYIDLLLLKGKTTMGVRYLLLDQYFSCASNYFFQIKEDEKKTVITQRFEGFINQSIYLYLSSQKPISLNQLPIIVTKTDPLNKQNKIRFELTHQSWRNNIKISLLDKSTLKLTISSQQSTTFKISPTGEDWSNPFCRQATSRIIISSDSEMNLNCTKFIELQIFKKKPVLIKQKNMSTHNLEFKESSEVAQPQMFEPKIQEENNIQNLVYVINDDCKRFLTRAGEPRTDYIQFCDSNHNPIIFTGAISVKFVHINKLAVIEPEIVRREMQHGLKWTPVVKGHYYLFINNFLMNPTYEIGVCAAQADHSISKVSPPKVVKLCFCEESQIMFDLRDSFKNIYSQLQEELIGDQLLIELIPDKLQKYLKMDKSPINKYGLKKVKFNFNYTEGQQKTRVMIDVLLNRERVLSFELQIEGYSLKQRKKLLDQDISAKDKRYYKDLLIHRSRFLEDIIMHAEKSLMTNVTIRFANQPGIDAGGVKRQFYDLIGNEMKSENNPFFRLVNTERMEYFLNPDILKNKKKEEYMEVWGKYLANSFLNTYLIGMSFSPVFVKMLYGMSIDYEDLLEVSTEDERKQYSYLLTASPDEFQDLCLFFTAVVDKKKAKEIELKPEGKDIQVTAENVKQYLELTAKELLTKRYETLIKAFRQGFNTVIDIDIIKKWIRPQQFWSLTAGTKEITSEIVLSYINFSGYNIENISGWFRRYITQATREILIGFLKFSSGSSSIDFSLTSKITVTFEDAGANPKKLPISHTCWKEIVIPKYKNYEIMHKLLNAAFIYCSEGFGFG